MNLGISNKKALITGGGRGLGLNIAECLAAEGVNVTLVARTQSDLDRFLDTHGNRHRGIALDLVPEGAPARLVDMLREDGLPDILIHNVGGTLNITDPLCGVDAWRASYRFNLEIAVELNHYLIPHLIEQKWGRVVHISSIASLENQGPPTYCAMKAALTAYTRSVGRYVSPHNVAVSSVLPGAVLTEGGYWDTASRERPEHVERYLKERMAIQRFGTPDEIGKLTTFLCSEYASFIAGSAFTADGGQGRGFLYNYES
ncbi:MAG TPA: SDR family oxidoreductase [Azonexus sp.]|nr:SDR family oxidoreductase [Azonexus sp.]